MASEPRKVEITVDFRSTLTIGDVWPDGDAPENPTSMDVARIVRAGIDDAGSVAAWLREWNLEDDVFGVWVRVAAPGAETIDVDEMDPGEGETDGD
jgi:hypothetical protein